MFLSTVVLGYHPWLRAVTEPRAEDSDPLAPLVAPVRAGDRTATRRMVEALAPSVRSVIVGAMGAQHPDVDDVTQEALVAILKALHTFRRESRVRYFAARIAVRIAREARTRRRRLDQRHQDLDETDLSTAGPDGVPARARRLALWQRLLSILPDEQAETVMLRVVLDYSLEEAAEAMQVPVNTVRSRMRLARETIRQQLERNPRYAEIMEEWR